MNGKRVLVVEADFSLAWLMRDFFEARGCQVELCTSGEEAYRLALAADYDLVTVNVKIPGMDGCLVIESITMVKPQTRVVMVSAAFDSPANVSNALSKATATLSIPIKQNDITRILEPLGL